MWYWIKSPAGVETDFNLRELTTALHEGRVRADWVARKHDERQWISVKDLLLSVQEDSQQEAPASSTADEERTESGRNQNMPSASFDCLECRTRLRIHLRKSQTTYRCPSCKCEYRTVQPDGESQVFLVVPALRINAKRSEDSSRQNRPVPSEVRNALASFGLDITASFEEARCAYREHIKQYHPDKVAHLGQELRKVAESKTKEINAAFQTLERFFTS